MFERREERRNEKRGEPFELAEGGLHRCFRAIFSESSQSEGASESEKLDLASCGS